MPQSETKRARRQRTQTVYMRSLFVTDVSTSGVVHVGDVPVTAPVHEQLLVGGPRGMASFNVQPNVRSFTRLHFANRRDDDDEDMNIGPRTWGEPQVLEEQALAALDRAYTLDRQAGVDISPGTTHFGHVDIVAVTYSACVLVGRHDVILPSVRSRLIGVVPGAISAAPGITGP